MTKRIDVAYPVFTKAYLGHVRKVLDYTLEQGRIFCIGRQGLFTYTNVDHCIDMGLKLGSMFEKGTLDKKSFYDTFNKYLQ
jgi:hypothetical protein